MAFGLGGAGGIVRPPGTGYMPGMPHIRTGLQPRMPMMPRPHLPHFHMGLGVHTHPTGDIPHVHNLGLNPMRPGGF